MIGQEPDPDRPWVRCKLLFKDKDKKEYQCIYQGPMIDLSLGTYDVLTKNGILKRLRKREIKP